MSEETVNRDARYLWYGIISGRGFANYPGKWVYLYSNYEIKYYDTESYDLAKETTGSVEPTEQDFLNLGITPDGYRSGCNCEDLIRIINGENLYFDDKPLKEDEGVSL